MESGHSLLRQTIWAQILSSQSVTALERMYSSWIPFASVLIQRVRSVEPFLTATLRSPRLMNRGF